MGNKQDIGKVFKEKLDNLQASPQDLIWNNIVAELDKKEKKRRVIPFWLKFGSIAAAILILSSIIWNYTKKESTNKNKIEFTTKDNSIKSNNKNNTLKDEKILDSNNVNSTITNALEVSKNDLINSDKNKEKKSNSSNNLNNNTLNNNKTITQNKDVSNYKSKSQNYKTKSNTQNSIFNSNNNSSNVSNLNLNKALNIASKPQVKAIYAKLNLENKNYLDFIFAKLPKLSNKIDITDEKPNNSDKEKIKKKWSVAINGSPIYYSSLNNGSSIDQNLESNNKTNKLTSSYGLQTSFALTNKISLRTGISKIDLAYNTKDVLLENVLTSQIVLSNNISGNYNEGCPLLNAFNEESFKLTQNINYLEIPIEVSYKLIYKKLGVNIITGLSALLLQKNNIIINDDVLLGTVNNLNKTSFTGNLGLGFNYKITNSINLNIEPMMKLQFNTYNDNTNYKPYYFGVYSGFSYQF